MPWHAYAIQAMREAIAAQQSQPATAQAPTPPRSGKEAWAPLAGLMDLTLAVGELVTRSASQKPTTSAAVKSVWRQALK